MTSSYISLGYLGAAMLFIFGLSQLSKVRTARRGNTMAAVAMLAAIVLTLIDLGSVDYRYIIAGLIAGSAIGAIAAMRVQMTQMPEMVALFNGVGGAASALVGLSFFFANVHKLADNPSVSAMLGGEHFAVTTVLSLLVGAVTLTGSVVAFLKLSGRMTGDPILLPLRHLLNIVLLGGTLGIGVWITTGVFTPASAIALILVVFFAALTLGVTAVIPIGGADMPVVISLLNSYSGVAAAMTGFVLSNNLLIIAGSLVGASGLILTNIMCKAMNRSLANVMLGGFGGDSQLGEKDTGGYTTVKESSAEEVALVLEDASSCIFVPGYGLAVAQAQHATRELADLLQKRGCKVSYAIHPVAGRMPGHMNVLLAEADVPYDQLFEMDVINGDFKSTDVSIVLGANDVVNPAALNDKSSPMYGMPILNVHESRMVFVVKRSLSPGFAGIRNELFELDNTNMVFGDAKAVLTEIISELKAA